MVTFKISKTYKGSYKEGTIVVSFIGGYVNGEDYINNINDEEFPIKEDGNRENLKEEVKGKILSLNIFKGETIPEVGKNYLMFLGEKSEFMGSRHGIIGMEYEQGLFEIQNGKVYEFKPNSRKNNELTNKVDIKLFIDAAKKLLIHHQKYYLFSFLRRTTINLVVLIVYSGENSDNIKV